MIGWESLLPLNHKCLVVQRKCAKRGIPCDAGLAVEITRISVLQHVASRDQGVLVPKHATVKKQQQRPFIVLVYERQLRLLTDLHRLPMLSNMLNIFQSLLLRYGFIHV